MIDELKKELIKLSDEKYRIFSSSLLPEIDNVLGVRLPILRKKAKELIKTNSYIDFLKENDDEFMEQTMLEGMIISGLKLNVQEHFKLIKKFIPKINNWAICDSFCAGLDVFCKDINKSKAFLEKYFNSSKEYELRFAYVILTYFYHNFDYEYIIDKLLKFNNDKYYAKMAAAWNLSYCFIFDYEKTIENAKKLNFHPYVIRKGITKAIESLRLLKEQKEQLKILRENLKNSKNIH